VIPVLYDLTDWIIGPLRDLLSQAVAWLSSLSLVAARGIDPARYLGQLAWLGPAWLGLVKHALLCVVLYVTLLAVRSAWQVYQDVKQSVKWW